jgi:hypothetical protein
MKKYYLHLLLVQSFFALKEAGGNEEKALGEGISTEVCPSSFSSCAEIIVKITGYLKDLWDWTQISRVNKFPLKKKFYFHYDYF